MESLLGLSSYVLFVERVYKRLLGYLSEKLWGYRIFGKLMWYGMFRHWKVSNDVSKQKGPIRVYLDTRYLGEKL